MIISTDERSIALGHDYNAVITAPDCVNGGYTTYTCTACGDTYVADEVAPNGHNKGEVVVENEVAPSCVNKASYDNVVYCTVCGVEISRETIAVDALTHTDADGDYICDYGCGHEFEKPEEPAPYEPTPDESTEDTVCADCGKVHDGFFSEFICFFIRIINFIKKLFA